MLCQAVYSSVRCWYLRRALIAQIHDGCTADQIKFLQSVCGAAAGGNVIQQQHLFNVYVHVGANEVNFTGKLQIAPRCGKPPY